MRLRGGKRKSGKREEADAPPEAPVATPGAAVAERTRSLKVEWL